MPEGAPTRATRWWCGNWTGSGVTCATSSTQCTTLPQRGIGLKVLTGHGAAIDTTTAAGKLVFGIFAALAEFERELIAERTIARLGVGTGTRGRKGGRAVQNDRRQTAVWRWLRWGSRKPRSAIYVGNSASPAKPFIAMSGRTAP
jgi:hypothetical protein